MDIYDNLNKTHLMVYPMEFDSVSHEVTVERPSTGEVEFRFRGIKSNIQHGNWFIYTRPDVSPYLYARFTANAVGQSDLFILDEDSEGARAVRAIMAQIEKGEIEERRVKISI